MRTVVMKQLKDGSGRACIHWLVPDPEGKITAVGDMRLTPAGPVAVAEVRCKIACRPWQNTVEPQIRGEEHFLCLRSEEPRAVTCPECQATQEYKDRMAILEEVSKTAQAVG